MNNSNDQLKIEYSKTDKESNSVRLICIFLIIIFTFTPLTEIVTDFDYNNITHYSRYTCLTGWDYSSEVLTFKEIK